MELISRAGMDKLIKEHMKIDKEIQQAQKEMGESAQRETLLTENSEYMELRVKAMYILPAKKEKLNYRIHNSNIIEETRDYKNFTDRVIVGSEVTMDYDGEEEIFKILGDNEGDIDNGIISCNAPIVKSLLNKRVKDRFLYNGMEVIIKKITRI